MLEFYLQKMIYLQFLKMMGTGEKHQEKNKNKIKPKKNLFGYPPILI